MLSWWTLNDGDCFGENFQPGEKEIHVLVELPEAHQDVLASIERGCTLRWLQLFRNSQVGPKGLPVVEELEEFINRELPVKVTISKQIYESWKMKISAGYPQLMTKMFRITNSETCVDFVTKIGNNVVDLAVHPAGTESSFISFWDTMIRNVLDFIGIGHSERYSSRMASSGSSLPDFLYIVDSVCVFRGEEKVPRESLETPRRELTDKLVWNYGNAPYLFGYAAAGYQAGLYAITHGRDRVITVPLGAYNLRTVGGRMGILLAILNIARLLQSIALLCPDSARDEHRQMTRDNGVKVKYFPEMLFQRAKDHAETVYKVLEQHSIPNVEHLHYADPNECRLIFKPRGQERRPANLVELFRALENVLQALAKLHAACCFVDASRYSMG